jgi:hypothetical protein
VSRFAVVLPDRTRRTRSGYGWRYAVAVLHDGAGAWAVFRWCKSDEAAAAAVKDASAKRYKRVEVLDAVRVVEAGSLFPDSQQPKGE